MQTISVKVGDHMTYAESIRNTEKSSNGRPGNVAAVKKMVQMITRKICVTVLKLQLREIGSRVRCDGKIKIVGTK